MKKAFSIMFLICLMLILNINTFAGDDRKEEVIVTIYNQNFAQIREIREIKLEQGDESWHITDLPAQIEPDSIFFEFYKQNEICEVVEQNYRFDLVNPDRLLSKYLFVNKDIDVFFNDGTKVDGSLIFFDKNNIILGQKNKDSEPIIINRASIKHIQLPENPNGLVTKPSLTCRLRTTHKAYYKVALTYLVNGLDWETNYTGIISTTDASMRLIGNVNIINSISDAFYNVKLNLVAGKVQKDLAKKDLKQQAVESAENFQEDKLLNYHFYSLERKANLQANSINQIPLFNFGDVKIKIVYTYNGRVDKDRAKVSLILKNDDFNGLGVSLPEGKIKLYNRDNSGVPVVVGEDAINNTPVGKDIDLTLGKAFDVTAERRAMETQKTKDGVEKLFEIELRNHKKNQVTVIVSENIYGDWEIIENSDPYIKKDANTIEFTCLIPDEGKKVIKYRVRIK